MRQKQSKKDEADRTVRNIKRRTRRKFNAEEKIRIVLAGLRGEDSVADKMNKKWTKRIDIYMGKNIETAKAWGKKTVTITWAN